MRTFATFSLCAALTALAAFAVPAQAEDFFDNPRLVTDSLAHPQVHPVNSAMVRTDVLLGEQAVTAAVAAPLPPPQIQPLPQFAPPPEVRPVTPEQFPTEPRPLPQVRQPVPPAPARQAAAEPARQPLPGQPVITATQAGAPEVITATTGEQAINMPLEIKLTQAATDVPIQYEIVQEGSDTPIHTALVKPGDPNVISFVVPIQIPVVHAEPIAQPAYTIAPAPAPAQPREPEPMPFGLNRAPAPGQVFAPVQPRATATQPLQPTDFDQTLNAVPPLSSGPEPVLELITPGQVKQALSQGVPMVILDVRGELVRDVEGHIPNDIHISYENPTSFAAEVARKIPDRTLPVIVYCHDGIWSSQAGSVLARMGYKPYLMGAYRLWVWN